MQAEENRQAAEHRLAGTLEALDRATDETRAAREQLEDAERDARDSALDRERFAAYLEEGLAMLGAAPAPSLHPRLDSDLGVPHDPDPPDAVEPGDERQRPTRSYAVVPDLEAELAAASRASTQSPDGEPDSEPLLDSDLLSDIEPEPLPDPTRPGSPTAD